ncbi:MAG: zf-HC2 domain-containing protein [Chloroflexi bacterium]|nr:zf-HC2 domain-containing protein [Chloroflexota bacterium]
MKCEQVQTALVLFLNGELTAPDRSSMQHHLAGCEVCRAELGRLTGQTLQRLTAEVEPSPQAWSRLQTRVAQMPVAHVSMAKDAQPSPGRLSQWLSRLAPSGGSTPTHYSGDKTMRTRSVVLSALATVIVVVALVAVFMTQNVAPVSAQQIIDRASAAQSAVKASRGINHIRIESYDNFQALDGNTAGTKTIVDSYLDVPTGNLRNVTTDADTGKVLDVFAYDGSNTYSTKGPLDSTATEPLTIYRSPQPQVVMGGGVAVGAVDFEQLFAELRSDPRVTVEGKQTWSDGRSVYVLSTQQPGKFLKDPNSLQTKRMFFDANTYRLLEEQATFQLADKEIVVADVHYLVNETLPANSPVAWNLSDLQGVSIVDDTDRTQGDLLPEKITAQDLAARTRTGYLLKTIPAGFSLELEAPPKQTNETSYIYIASYRTEAGDYFVIQAGGAPQLLPEDTQEVYTTTTGLVVQFMLDTVTPEGKHYQNAAVKAPDGTAFMISSTLPRERVKALAEDLVIAR